MWVKWRQLSEGGACDGREGLKMGGMRSARRTETNTEKICDLRESTGDSDAGRVIKKQNRRERA